MKGWPPTTRALHRDDDYSGDDATITTSNGLAVTVPTREALLASATNSTSSAHPRRPQWFQQSSAIANRGDAFTTAERRRRLSQQDRDEDGRLLLMNPSSTAVHSLRGHAPTRDDRTAAAIAQASRFIATQTQAANISEPSLRTRRKRVKRESSVTTSSSSGSAPASASPHRGGGCTLGGVTGVGRRIHNEGLRRVEIIADEAERERTKGMDEKAVDNDKSHGTMVASAAASAALRHHVSCAASTMTASQICHTWGGLRAMVRALVGEAVGRAVPPPRGVLKRLREGKPASVANARDGVRLDDDDEQALRTFRLPPVPLSSPSPPTRGAAASSRQPPQQQQNPRYVIDDEALGYQITAAQLTRLLRGEKLDDQTINYYCDLVGATIPGVCTLGTFLYTKISGTDREGAHRWCRRRPLFTSRVILIVVNRSDHWTLCAVNHVHGTISYYDSLGGKGLDVMRRVASFLDEAYERKCGKPLPAAVHSNHKGPGGTVSTTFTPRPPGGGGGGVPLLDAGSYEGPRFRYADFVLLSPSAPSSSSSSSLSSSSSSSSLSSHRAAASAAVTAVPQQEGVIDCGVFVSQFCLYVALSRPMLFTQADVPYIRRVMTLELLSRNVLRRL